jgi:hypothetical protein
MFCNRCGTKITPESLGCANCGRGVCDPAGAVVQSRLARHRQTLGGLWIAIAGLFLIPAIGLMVFAPNTRFVIHDREPWPGLFSLLLYIAGGTLVIFATGGVCVGLGLKQHRPWVRGAATIVGTLALFLPPLGTALGVYTLWVMLADEEEDEYRHSPALPRWAIPTDMHKNS